MSSQIQAVRADKSNMDKHKQTHVHSGCSTVGTNVPASVTPAVWLLFCIMRNLFYLLPGLLKNLPRKSHIGSFMWLNIGSNTRAAPSLENEVQGLSRCNFWDVRGIALRNFDQTTHFNHLRPLLFVQRWPNPGLVCRSNLAHAIRCHVRHPSCVHLATFASCCCHILLATLVARWEGAQDLPLWTRTRRQRKTERGLFKDTGIANVQTSFKQEACLS